MIDLKEIPKTRYQGSKRKIAPWIASIMEDLKFETVLDGFGGSGTVSYLLKKWVNLLLTMITEVQLHNWKGYNSEPKVKFSEADIENLLNGPLIIPMMGLLKGLLMGFITSDLRTGG
ncbi:MAG: DNA adenine methylase [Bacteroidetes bacterium]|nr:DNA adenine methylase [Bacteroidota bacterium]